MTSKRSIYITILSLLIFTGCAQRPQIEQAFDFEQHKIDAGNLKQWEIRARFSVKTSEQAFSASLTWLEQQNKQQLEIHGMLGQTYANLLITPEQAELIVEDDPPYRAPTAERLMLQHLGYVIPMSYLTDWIRAIPSGADKKDMKFDDKGYLESIRVQQWRVSYSRYKRFAGMKHIELPSRITLENGFETIKLAVKGWQEQ